MFLNPYKQSVLMLCFGCLLILSFHSAVAAVSPNETLKIFRTLSNGNISFKISNNTEVNASSGCSNVTMFKGMMNFVKNSDEMALVLGHELGHIANRDCTHIGTPTYNMEYNADLYGFKLIKNKGYNACRAIVLLKSFGYKHPNGIDRYNRLKRYCK